MHRGRITWLIGHHPEEELGSFVSKLTTGSWQTIRLRCTVCMPTFLRRTRNARHARVTAASPAQLGPRGSEVEESSRMVSWKLSAPGSSCGNWSAVERHGKMEKMDNPSKTQRNTRIRNPPPMYAHISASLLPM